LVCIISAFDGCIQRNILSYAIPSLMTITRYVVVEVLLILCYY